MSDHDSASHDQSPKHLLETGLLGKPKYGRQRVSELTAQQGEFVHAVSPQDAADNPIDQEKST